MADPKYSDDAVSLQECVEEFLEKRYKPLCDDFLEFLNSNNVVGPDMLYSYQYESRFRGLIPELEFIIRSLMSTKDHIIDLEETINKNEKKR